MVKIVKIPADINEPFEEIDVKIKNKSNEVESVLNYCKSYFSKIKLSSDNDPLSKKIYYKIKK